ncbi:hypothetical protein LOTGIDRAFT_131920 [Lottia gigantea]|uniref:SRCR domain-containing protein n=1 Tax=Lottia gigantea TaxID=225164 RepID=V3Z1W0_LOTGI|nr:hypothetical protein LOTGIDRAFT_131920 [Lottia gigantea]ESO84538.1 hypothetical protein LOTGIDRAFT_131920 [Lottia gigantea]
MFKYCFISDPVTLRLSTERGPVEGRVEVYHSGEWGNVCDDNFGVPDATVVCRQLGYLDPKSWFINKGKFWLDGLACRGTESKVQDCTHLQWGSNNCQLSEQVGVDCSE